MNQWTEAEIYMMDQIRRGEGEGWSQLVQRYQGRLIAYARRRAPADAEDLVQDTFLQFLRGVANFREESSVETFLFVILRRRLAEKRRGKKIMACELPQSDDSPDAAQTLAAPDPSASWYVRRDEQREVARSALASALMSIVHEMKEDLQLSNLQILEMLFYAQRPNQEIARELNIDANYVAVHKHRWLKQLQDRVGTSVQSEALDSLLTEVWEDQRPSCPKRSTVGAYVLETLDDPWRQYVDFHINRLGCTFCRANLEDLQLPANEDSAPLRERIMQSTVGFLKK